MRSFLGLRFARKGDFCPPENTWPCRNTCLVVLVGDVLLTPGGRRPGLPLTSPQCTGSPSAEKDLAPKARGAQAEKPALGYLSLAGAVGSVCYRPKDGLLGEGQVPGPARGAGIQILKESWKSEGQLKGSRLHAEEMRLP